MKTKIAFVLLMTTMKSDHLRTLARKSFGGGKMVPLWTVTLAATVCAIGLTVLPQARYCTLPLLLFAQSSAISIDPLPENLKSVPFLKVLRELETNTTWLGVRLLVTAIIVALIYAGTGASR